MQRDIELFLEYKLDGTLLCQAQCRGELKEFDDVQPSCACFNGGQSLLGPTQCARYFALGQTQLFTTVAESFDQPSVVNAVDGLGGHGRRQLWATEESMTHPPIT